MHAAVEVAAAMLNTYAGTEGGSACMGAVLADVLFERL